MATVEIHDDRLVVRLAGWERVWALKAGVDVPLAGVRRVEPAPPDIRPRGLRAPGSYLPRVIAAGTYRRRGGKEFWSVRDPSRAIVIDLAGADYDRLVVQVADPTATIAAIRSAVALDSPVHPAAGT